MIDFVAYKQWNLFLSSRVWKVQDKGLVRGCFLVNRWLTSQCSHTWKGQESSLGALFIRSLILFMRPPLSWITSQTSPPNTITLGIRFQLMNQQVETQTLSLLQSLMYNTYWAWHLSSWHSGIKWIRSQ